MAALPIEDFIRHDLPPEAQRVALAFVAFLADQRLCFHKDDGMYWENKVYYWVTLAGQCVCFIAIMDPDDPTHQWTVWSADMGSPGLAAPADPLLQEAAWKHVDHCGHCGSCSGGRRRTIFGKTFHDVCGCTFRVDDPQPADMPFLKAMVDIRIREIISDP